MSLTPSRLSRRTVLTLAAALVASVLSTVPAGVADASPAVPAAVLLPSPVVTPTAIPAGTVASVVGARCVPKQFTRVYVSLTTPGGDLIVSSSVTPTADGTWTAHVSPPVGTTVGTYAVSATCDRYGSQSTYRPRTVTVTASSAAPWTGREPSLPDVPNGSLRDVDCATAISCVAVGTVGLGGSTRPLVETWDGSTWTVAAVTSPVAGDVYLDSVDCPGTTRCVAVGDIGTATGHESFVATLDGTTWTTRVLDPPSGEREGSLTGVSCPVVQVCLAVGSTGSLSEGSHYEPVSYRLQGTTWTQLVDPVAVSQRSDLFALSCVNVRTCVAVGTDTQSFPSRPVAQVFDGTLWHTMRLAPVDPAESPRLSDVSCATVSSCVAVGSTSAGDGTGQPLVQVFAKTTWRRAAVTVDPAIGGGLQNVSCASSSRCTAVGATGQYQATSPDRPVAVTLTGGVWTGAVVDLPPGAPESRLSGVSCAGSTCVAVGDTRNVPLAAVTTGDGWTDTGAVAADGYVGGEFDAVDCTTADRCTAGGWSYAADRETATPLVNRWNGTVWTRQPLPAVGNARIAGVACPSTTLCFAVGAIGDPDQSQLPLLLQWRGGVWRQLRVRLPRNGTGLLTAVSCASPTSCLAVGQTGAYGGDPFAVSLTGTAWSVTPAAPVDGLQYVSLTGVSCTGDGCRIVGQGFDEVTFSSQGVDLVWNGSSYAAGPAVDPRHAVSCIALLLCVAVGGFSDAGSTASVLSGSGWTTEALPGSATAEGVDCAVPPTLAAGSGPPSCVAVGSGSDGAYVARRDGAGSWTQEPVAALVPRYGTLEGVSCPSDRQCVAVGGAGVPTIVVSPTG